MVSMVVYTDLYPSTTQGTAVCAATASGTQTQIRDWLCGQVNARGVTPGWTSALSWWVERAGLVWRKPIRPDGSPTSGQGWPR